MTRSGPIYYQALNLNDLDRTMVQAMREGMDVSTVLSWSGYFGEGLVAVLNHHFAKISH